MFSDPCWWQDLWGTAGFVATQARILPGSVHSAHPWYTQAGLLDVGAAPNKEAFLKWVDPF